MKAIFYTLLTAMGILYACTNEKEEDLLPEPSLKITKRNENSTVGTHHNFSYQENMMTKYVYEEFLIYNDIYKSNVYTSTKHSGTEAFVCYKNATVYNSSYPVEKNSGLCTHVTRTNSPTDDTHNYTIDYTLINNTYYIQKITHETEGNVLYALTFDYTDFDNNEITIIQTLFGVEKINARLTIDRHNIKAIPDIQLTEFYPMDKLIEGIYGGYMGRFDYFITKMVLNNKETRTASVQKDADGYPSKITVASGNNITIYDYTCVRIDYTLKSALY